MATSLRAAREAYFAANAFGPNGGYEERWVKVKLGPIPLAFPNFSARRRAVKVHDLHHVLTGYRTDLAGEGAISAYEIAVGCGDFVAAWLINLMGMCWGLLFAPAESLRAYARGRRSRSLYHRDIDEELLDRSVEEVRRELGIPPPDVRPTALECGAFVMTAAVAVAWSGLVVATLCAPVAMIALVVFY